MELRLVRTALSVAAVLLVLAGATPSPAATTLGQTTDGRSPIPARTAARLVEPLPLPAGRAEESPPEPADDLSAPVDREALEEVPGVRERAAAVLAALPGGTRVEIVWDDPQIGNHLGGVRLDDPHRMMLSSRRLEASPGRLVDTVLHEIAHIYQGWLVTSLAGHGEWWDGYWELDAALRPLFGESWMELSADCLALELGARWTHYTRSCTEEQAEAARGLLDGRLP